MTPALSIYLLAAARAEPLMSRRSVDQTHPRERSPSSDIVWIHVGTGEPTESALTLAGRIGEERLETSFVVTSDEAGQGGDNLTWTKRPIDFPRAVESFLSAWEPAACVWIGGPVWPVLAAKARQAVPHMLLVNATDALASSHRGIPARDLLGLFNRIEASGETHRHALERAARHPVAVIGRLQRSTEPLDHDESERHRLTTALQARPVWFAAGATATEAEMVRTAHAIGQSASHRLLLIVEPADETAASSYAASYGAHRSAGTTPPPGASALVADVAGETGLWFRLATVSFMGGTLAGPSATTDPFAPAALGSAVLHGPTLAPYAGHFAELRAAGATRPVRNAQSLGGAVEELLAPDRAADLARKAWEVISDGAEATDHVAEEVCRLLDGTP